MSEESAPRSDALRRRVPTALAYGLVVLGALWLGELVFLMAIVAGGLLAYYELWRMFARTRYAPSLGGGLFLVTTFLFLHFYWARARSAPAEDLAQGLLWPIGTANVVAIALIVAGIVAVRRTELSNGLLAGTFTVVGALYCGWLLGYLIDLGVVGSRVVGGHFDPTFEEILKRSWLLLAILPTWANDVAAYGIGRAFGRRRLLPHVSPGKTVEGTLGGIAAAVIVATLMVGLFEFSPWIGIAAGALVGVFAVLGDLVESAVKRAAVAKDSGALLPGHGGVLDRVDSLIFVAPVLSIFFETVLLVTR
jgi:phosphatidate cytidylyltransferase